MVDWTIEITKLQVKESVTHISECWSISWVELILLKLTHSRPQSILGIKACDVKYTEKCKNITF